MRAAAGPVRGEVAQRTPIRFARVLTLGIDLAADPRKTACCLVDWERHTVEVLPGSLPDEELVRQIMRSDVTAIDVPLGWPDRFVDAVVAHRDHRSWPAEDGDRVPLRFRRTDEVLRNRGIHPLSVSSDLIGVPAMRGAYLQRLLSETGEEVDRSGLSGAVLEGYPAAALRTWGLRSSGYKGSANRFTLAALRGDLVARCGVLTAAAQAALDGCTHDELDAFVCALVARAARLGLTDGPGDDDLDAARREGWIHVPTVILEELVRPDLARPDDARQD